MNKSNKIIIYSITIGIVLLGTLFFVAINLMGIAPQNTKSKEITNRDKIIEKINTFHSVSDTIAAINRISTFEQDYNIPPIIDSISYNRLQICPVCDITEIPDSVAYIRYLYADGSTRCEGWVAYSSDPEDDSSNQFGEWNYYDEEGNCYRKFWNYKTNDVLIYETNR